MKQGNDFGGATFDRRPDEGASSSGSRPQPERTECDVMIALCATGDGDAASYFIGNTSAKGLMASGAAR
ncbi:MAG: hypothetical protein ACT6RN_16690 [Agrobacterium sp.]|uniref:hypothetical protein n=1 Tax=Agrobacterium sp. TaxID=361 RepID=UPI0040383CA9